MELIHILETALEYLVQFAIVIFEFIVFILFSIIKGKSQDKEKEIDTLNKENLNE